MLGDEEDSFKQFVTQTRGGQGEMIAHVAQLEPKGCW